jgi:FMNH2-dependent dimethyl sulfone monooxygenase
MSEILTCTWAPTNTGAGPQLVRKPDRTSRISNAEVSGEALQARMLRNVRLAEELGIDNLLVAQRWWGTAQEIESSSYDCLAMTAFYAAHTRRIKLITAIHPGFFLPSVIAKWGVTIDRLTGGRWAINVTSGWNEAEFEMYGAGLLPHDERYVRSREFIEVLRGAWSHDEFSYEGRYYNVRGLRLEPRPVNPYFEIWQGGQSPAAMEMAVDHSDWMFMNGGPPAKIRGIINEVRRRAERTGRRIRFALYSIPLCRETDAEAERVIAAMLDAQDPAMIERRKLRTSGAHGMWSSLDDRLTLLDTNEGYASRLIGSPQTILNRMLEFHEMGVDCFHLTLNDDLFNREVLSALRLVAPR